MRQVPPYLVIGNGRMATHFCHYLTLLDLPFIQWSRKQHSPQDLIAAVNQVSHVLILIKDAAISHFVQEKAFLFQDKVLIHFSGQLSVDGIHSAHPLMTFTQDLYDKESYPQIPFILVEKGPAFSALLPHLPNPFYYIPKELKTFYHALCVIGNNFTCMLWRKLFQELTQTFQLPSEVAFPYLTQTFKNIAKNPQGALTGPLARKDFNTINAHLDALKNDEFLDIYRSFVQVFTQGDKL